MTMSSTASGTSLTPGALLAHLKHRGAIKKFDPARRVPVEAWASLEAALVLSPSSFGLQPWRFVVVTNPALRAELRTHSWDQAQIVDSSHIVVFAVKKNIGAPDVERLIARIAEVRGTPAAKLEPYRQMMLGFFKAGAGTMDVDAWSARQVYIALGFFMTSAAVMGIDTCPIEGINPAEYDRVLGLGKEGYGTLCVCAAGYRAADDPYSAMPKVRYEAKDIVHHAG